MTNLRALDLFAGMGGFGLAGQNAGLDIVYANEFDKYAADLHDANFVRKVDRRSIVDVPADEIPEHDVILAGFPCQAFTIAGKRGGFEDERGKLFPEIMRIATHHRTPLIVLENVKGLVSHDGGRTLETILRWLREAGYSVDHKVLSTWRHAGIPQSRERIYIVAMLGQSVPPSLFPDEVPDLPGDGDTLPWRDYLDAPEDVPERYWFRPGSSMYDKFVAHFGKTDRTEGWTVTPGEHGLVATGSGDPESVVVKQHLAHRFREHGFVPTLMANGDSSSGKVPMALDRVYKRHRAAEMRTHNGVPAMMANMGTGGGLVPMALEAQGAVLHPRKFTERECARFQGFPDDFVLDVVSPTRQFKAIGNAVTVTLAERVIRSAVALHTFRASLPLAA